VRGNNCERLGVRGDEHGAGKKEGVDIGVEGLRSGQGYGGCAVIVGGWKGWM